jgi:hypothetical protein
VYLNALHIRLSLMALGIVSLITFLALGGRLGPGNKGVIQIDYGIEPRSFAGLEVEIDGQTAGTLRPFGNASRTGFEVAKGMHQVRVRHPEFACEPRRVEVEPGRNVLLILDVGEGADAKGSMRSVLELR